MLDLAEKDTAEKVLMAWNDVFADIMNVLLFHGNREIKEEELEDALTFSSYEDEEDESLRAQERDVAKYWHNGVLRIARLGIENQTNSDQTMPLRIIAYDGAAYRNQIVHKLSLAGVEKERVENAYTSEDKAADEVDKCKTNGFKRKNRFYPCVTLVLHFDYENKWTGPLSLKECLDYPDELDHVINDYPLHVVDIAWLDDETVAKFTSDFRIVVDYFIQMRKNRNYNPSDYRIEHVYEILHMMTVLTQDQRFLEGYYENIENGRETINMCEALDKIENRGIQKGIEQGIEQTNALNAWLITSGRFDALARSTTDAAYQKTLMEEYRKTVSAEQSV